MANLAKIILSKNGEVSDVRYIELHGSFAGLRQGIFTFFQIPQETEVRITWIDRDGDHIRIVNDVDLDIALSQMQDHRVFHVTYGINKPSVSFDDQNEQAEVPLGTRVVCDVCEAPVTGYRYKCLECLDFDLCSTCENAGHHSEHIFLRLPNSEFPLSRADRRILFGAARELKKTAYNACRRAHRLGRETLRSAFHSREPKNEKSSKSTTQSCPGTSGTECPFTAEINLDEINKLGSLARDHFYPVLRTCPDGSNLISDVIKNAVEAVFGPAFRAAAQNEAGNNTNDQPTASTSQSTGTTATTTTANTDGNAQAKPTESEKEKSAAESTEMDWTLINNNQVPIVIPDTPATPPMPATPATTPVIPPTASAPSEGNTTQTTTSAPPPGFLLHSDPVIAHGLSQLYEMGFSNENGLLTVLLRRYKGDVPEVVKTIVNFK